LSSRDVTHKTTPSKVLFDGHSNLIVFNIIKTPFNLIILGLSWLKSFNLSIDWKLHKVTFSIKPAKKSQIIKPLFVGARIFMKVVKKCISFVIYATPTCKQDNTTTKILK